jgi:hypothetical protein
VVRVGVSGEQRRPPPFFEVLSLVDDDRVELGSEFCCRIDEHLRQIVLEER